MLKCTPPPILKILLIDHPSNTRKRCSTPLQTPYRSLLQKVKSKFLTSLICPFFPVIFNRNLCYFLMFFAFFPFFFFFFQNQFSIFFAILTGKRKIPDVFRDSLLFFSFYRLTRFFEKFIITPENPQIKNFQLTLLRKYECESIKLNH